MIAIPAILAQCAERAGMQVPKDPEDYDAEQYPHWYVYCAMQLGAPLPDAQAHWDNAKVVAAIPDTQIRKVSNQALIRKGFRVGYSK